MFDIGWKRGLIKIILFLYLLTVKWKIRGRFSDNLVELTNFFGRLRAKEIKIRIVENNPSTWRISVFTPISCHYLYLAKTEDI